MTTDADKPRDIKYSEEYADANAVTLHFDEGTQRYVARHSGGGDTKCAVVVLAMKRRRSPDTRPSAPPAVMPFQQEMTPDKDTENFSSILSEDDGHVKARAAWKRAFDTSYNALRNEQSKERLLDIVEPVSRLVLTAATAAYRLGLRTKEKNR